MVLTNFLPSRTKNNAAPRPPDAPGLGCPNDCSHHGRCDPTTGLCQCDASYRLNPDCSVGVFDLKPNTTVSGTLDTNLVYYKLNNTEARIRIHVDVSLSNISYTVLVGYNTLPTINRYLTGCLSLSLTPCSLSIDYPVTGDYYIGIYSAPSLNYNLSATCGPFCLNSCSNNGVCQQNSTCSCLPYYSGTDCRQYVRPLNASSLLNECMWPATKIYYKYNNTPNQNLDLQIMLQDTDPSLQLAIYSAHNKIPTPLEYDSAQLCSTTKCSIHAQTSSADYWTFLVLFPTHQDDNPPSCIKYSVALAASVTCPNNCSLHGLCNQDGTCHCEPYYQKEDCSLFLMPLSNSTTIDTQLQPSRWAYYSLSVNMDNAISFSVFNITNTSVFTVVQRETLPTFQSYIELSNQPSNQSIIILSDSQPLNGTYYFGTYNSGNSSTSLTISASSYKQCLRNCSGNGKCIDGVCQCDERWVKNDCSAYNMFLNFNSGARGTVQFNSWNYYTANLQESLTFRAYVTEDENLLYGLIWVFAANGRLPTIEDHDYADQSSSSSHNLLIPASQSGNWTIGITRSPSSLQPQLRHTSYTIWLVAGCSAHSSCTTCVADASCGWCLTNLFNHEDGICVYGNREKPFDSLLSCPFYQYSVCTQDSKNRTQLEYEIGIILGLSIVLLFCASIFITHKLRSNRKKKTMLPIRLPNEPNSQEPTPSPTLFSRIFSLFRSSKKEGRRLLHVHPPVYSTPQGPS
ncbi:uncharacterized protein LOC126328048 [Schistocerca gregaria]|uniref:uncharacterized protein LOC126328048 n=1 Tax=Schistocerca gregaria TaxID=7010 RepID=UPI00211EE5D6|nr:uncharacterized protein LOC126328048 [Schistocerca gregaria]